MKVQKIKTTLTPEVLIVLYNYCIQKAKEPYEQDTQMPGTPAWYGDAMMKALQLLLLKTMEKNTGLELWPTYTYWRFYKYGDELVKHTDRPSCEISATFHIGHEGNDWTIFIDDGEGIKEFLLKPGEMALYNGPKWPHWRDEYKGGRYAQAFFHYVDKNGPNADWKYDKHETY